MLLFLLVIFHFAYGNYCGSGPTTQIDTNLGAVHVVGYNGTRINDTTNVCPGAIGVQNMTNQTVTLQVGHNVTIHVNTSSCGYYYKALTGVWVDWNHNQVYEPSELVFNFSGYGWHNGSFVVPANATWGFTRMRVQAQEGATYPLNPCEEFPYGGTKEFGVIVMSNYTPPPANYCSSGPTTGIDTNLGTVRLVGFNKTINDLNNTCPGPIGAQNLTWMVANLVVGDNYTIQFNTTTCGREYNVFTAVWIDYNQDHVFNESELVYNVSGYGMHNGSFRIPHNALLGTTRMRVQAQESHSYPLNPCLDFPYGGTKDFGIIILASNSSNNQTNTSKYCASGPSNPQNFTTLGAFQFNGETHNISDVNSTTCPGIGGVQNLTAQWANVILGGTYTASLNVTHCGNKTLAIPFSAIWIDYNQNFVYDKDELVYNVSGYGFHIAKFEIPITALKGNTTMRVQTQENGTYPLNPCANFTHGATKEYTIVLPTFHYCTSGPTMPKGTTLGSVAFVGNNLYIKDSSTACHNVGPQDLSKQVADVTRGRKYTLAYDVTSCDAEYFAESAVWIDWNENFVFESSELVYNATGYGEKKATVAIPWNVPVGGSTRMRVQVQETRQSRLIDPCAKFSYGSTKDFTLKFA